MANSKGGMMNTRGPNGGKGKVNQTSGNRTVRSTSYTARAGTDRGDTKQIASRNLQGQKPVTSRISKVRQAPQNRGPFTDFSVSGQNLSATRGIPKQASVNSGPMTSRNTQNTMKGKGTPAG